jgi:hypothetical protein
MGGVNSRSYAFIGQQIALHYLLPNRGRLLFERADVDWPNSAAFTIGVPTTPVKGKNQIFCRDLIILLEKVLELSFMYPEEEGCLIDMTGLGFVKG